MKIIVKADGHNIRLWFPLSIVKTRIGYKVIKDMMGKSRKDDDEQVQEQLPTQAEQAAEPSLSHQQVVEIYNVLKQCVKANGHFNLVEVHSHDGETVLIKI